MIFEIFAYGFMRNALLGALMVSLACGIVGTLVVLKKLVFMSGGISHSAFGGIGLGYLLGLNPVLVAIPFSLLASIGVGMISRRTQVKEDVAIGILWSVGMAMGIIFINLAPGYAPDLFSYLFGSILTIPVLELMVVFLLDMVTLTIFILFHKEFYAMSFDEEFATVAGVPVRALYYVLLGMIGLSVVVLIRVVGVILVIALLTIPTVISMKFTSGIMKLSFFSSVIGLICTVTGLFISYFFNLTSGATIVMVLASAFLVSTLVKRLKFLRSKLKN